VVHWLKDRNKIVSEDTEEEKQIKEPSKFKMLSPKAVKKRIKEILLEADAIARPFN
tara:strand:+ start:872 stop:1039 length:168 start_codon:yes stop_codon:yes gene_type:complete